VSPRGRHSILPPSAAASAVMAAKVDLSAYPVLRIDEIPIHSEETLQKCVIDCQQLIQKLQLEADDGNKSMLRYLLKQLDTMTAELVKRSAQNRIDKMLRGEMDLLNQDYYKSPSIAEAVPAASAVHLQPTSAPAKISLQSAPLVRQVPLPSQLKYVEAQNETTPNCKPKRQSLSRESGSAASLDCEDTESSRGAILKSQSSPSLESSVSRKVLRQPDMKKSIESYNNSFGVTFVVAATEKKRRFLPKKKQNDSSVEENKEKDRLSR
jgi:hypothetical protein